MKILGKIWRYKAKKNYKKQRKKCGVRGGYKTIDCHHCGGIIHICIKTNKCCTKFSCPASEGLYK